MSDLPGPVFAGAFKEFVIWDEAGAGYMLLFLPDHNNDALQRERKAPVFCCIPEKIRLGVNAATNDFKFRHIHFVGVFDESFAGIDQGESRCTTACGGLSRLPSRSARVAARPTAPSFAMSCEFEMEAFAQSGKWCTVGKD